MAQFYEQKCAACRGKGYTYHGLFANVAVICPFCNGKKYRTVYLSSRRR